MYQYSVECISARPFMHGRVEWIAHLATSRLLRMSTTPKFPRRRRRRMCRRALAIAPLLPRRYPSARPAWRRWLRRHRVQTKQPAIAAACSRAPAAWRAKSSPPARTNARRQSSSCDYADPCAVRLCAGRSMACLRYQATSIGDGSARLVTLLCFYLKIEKKRKRENVMNWVDSVIWYFCSEKNWSSLL